MTGAVGTTLPPKAGRARWWAQEGGVRRERRRV